MRVDGGLQGYYYDQGRFRRPDADQGEKPAVSQPAAVRIATGFSPGVGSSTVLSHSLSSALWALETRDTSSRPLPRPMPGMTDQDTAEKVSALYMEYADDGAAFS